MLGQMSCWAYAGQQHDMWGADRAGCENDLAKAARPLRRAALPPAHADGAASIEFDALHQASCFEPKIAAMERRFEKCSRRRPAPAAFLVHMKCAATFVVSCIKIRDGFDAGLRSGGAEGFEQSPLHAWCFNPQFPAGRMRV